MNFTFNHLARDGASIITGLFGMVLRAGAYGLIWFYRLIIKPLFPTASCRFEPSCSEYALQAVSRFGALKGAWLAARRLARCNPWGPYGPDPVPEPCPGPNHRPPHRPPHHPPIRLPREHP